MFKKKFKLRNHHNKQSCCRSISFCLTFPRTSDVWQSYDHHLTQQQYIGTNDTSYSFGKMGEKADKATKRTQLSSFIHFRSEMIKRMREHVSKQRQKDMSVYLALLWNKMPPNEKLKWKTDAEVIFMSSNL